MTEEMSCMLNRFKPIIEKVESLQSFDELNKQFPEWLLDTLPLPFNLDVDADMKKMRKRTPSLLIRRLLYSFQIRRIMHQTIPTVHN